MSAFTPRAMPDDLARLRVLEASIETLKAENEILKRRLAAAETRAAQAVITKRLDARWGPSAPGPGVGVWRGEIRSALPLLAKLPHEKRMPR